MHQPGAGWGRERQAEGLGSALGALGSPGRLGRAGQLWGHVEDREGAVQVLLSPLDTISPLGDSGGASSGGTSLGAASLGAASLGAASLGAGLAASLPLGAALAAVGEVFRMLGLRRSPAPSRARESPPPPWPWPVQPIQTDYRKSIFNLSLIPSLQDQVSPCPGQALPRPSRPQGPNLLGPGGKISSSPGLETGHLVLTTASPPCPALPCLLVPGPLGPQPQ